MHLDPAGQSLELVHVGVVPHGVQPAQQNTSPSVVLLQRQIGSQTSLPHESSTNGSHDQVQRSGDVTANAGVLRLDRTGAVHAIAAPAPIRFSAFRREIP